MKVVPKKIRIGSSDLNLIDKEVEGKLIQKGKDVFYKISNYDEMAPFFMSLVSSSDHWLFISSTGGLTAGRRNENNALFPYYTDEKISASFENTGAKTIIKVKAGHVTYLWEPFSNLYPDVYKIQRNLYKNKAGTKLLFEEINDDLELSFSYSWSFSEEYGFVRNSEIMNLKSEIAKIELVDGIQNVLPYGVNSSLQNERSNLVNAYKKSELVSDVSLGLYTLSSLIVDKAEPSEALKATTVWSCGLDSKDILLSNLQLKAYRRGYNLVQEEDKKAEPGAFMISSEFTLDYKQSKSWLIVAEVSQDHSAVIDLISQLRKEGTNMYSLVQNDVSSTSEELVRMVCQSDGLQASSDDLITLRHYNNVLFNIMRGGIFRDSYNLDIADFALYLNIVNSEVYQKHSKFLESIEKYIPFHQFKEMMVGTQDLNLLRIFNEYLPISFSRRHGDPSRPWNKFSIETKKEDGRPNLAYQGNWRDIFQNWEALAFSFPDFISSMITRFLNASTIDGYNPYRILRDGIDWEVIEPDDPWSYIGYWGDHQIIYLLKLLEFSCNLRKEELNSSLNSSFFVYANVPYKIKSYKDILIDPKDTIDYDHDLEEIIESRVDKMGSDGKIVFRQDGRSLTASLTEKLLVTLLAKLSNYVPDAGIWLNTQRPEWNDANNALVGNGVSMVTSYYMRRFIQFLIRLFDDSSHQEFQLNQPVLSHLNETHKAFQEFEKYLGTPFSDTNRKQLMDILGIAGEAYRKSGYEAFGDSSVVQMSKSSLLEFLELAQRFIDDTILKNKRTDGLFHSYNLIYIQDDTCKMEYLYEMLEGQVSALSSGLLNASQALDLLDSLKDSKLFRADQYSYLLYPDRKLPNFLQKNIIPSDFIHKSPLAKKLKEDENTAVFSWDCEGGHHFNGLFTNANLLEAELELLEKSTYGDLVKSEKEAYLDCFEEIFNHKSFTGRSGTFFGYEGLGSIYWHMVSKLLLAVQENIVEAKEQNADASIISRLVDHYYEIRAGIGAHKSPELYGAFSVDPYSHTPGNKGAQQPGMTGQVKEDILNRFSELGIRIVEGRLIIDPFFIDKKEFLLEEKKFEYYAVAEHLNEIQLSAGEMAFTFCQVPVIISQSASDKMIIEFNNGEKEEVEGVSLPLNYSREVFNRTGNIKSIKVYAAI